MNIGLLNKLFNHHNIKATIINAAKGAAFTRYEAEIDPFHFQIDKIFAIEENISHLLKSPELPIIFPIYERSVVAIDVVNVDREDVHFEAVLADAVDVANYKLPLVLGHTVYNKPFIVDLVDAPHILIAGTTGSGKSVGLRSIVTGLLHFVKDVQVYMIDPKRVEMSIFSGHESTDIITDIDEALAALDTLLFDIETRYEALREQGVNNIADAEGLPYVALVIDELADLFVGNKRIKESLLKIIQKSRAAGVHVIAATQRPSVDVVSGIIKSNFPTRIAFKVSSQEDSRIILGSKGAERLLGKGDMLYRKSAGSFERIQGAYITNKNILSVLGHNNETNEF